MRRLRLPDHTGQSVSDLLVLKRKRPLPVRLGSQLCGSLMGDTHDRADVTQRHSGGSQCFGSGACLCGGLCPCCRFTLPEASGTFRMLHIGFWEHRHDVDHDIRFRDAGKVSDNFTHLLVNLVEPAHLRHDSKVGLFQNPPSRRSPFRCDRKCLGHRHHPFQSSFENWSKNLRAVRPSISPCRSSVLEVSRS